MYYYILEAPPNRAARQLYERLRDTLTNLGISGEMVLASPARTPAELAVTGIERGYSTIVAVGGDGHIGQVATSILGRAVLGVVPINATKQVTDLIGSATIHEAAEALKKRRLNSVGTVMIGESSPIFLDGVIESEKLAKVSLIIDNKLRVFAYFNRIVVNRSLEISLESTHLTEPKKLFGLFNVGGDVIKSESLFHGRSIRLMTDPELPLSVGGKVISNTPLSFRLVPESLKVITRRGTLDG